MFLTALDLISVYAWPELSDFGPELLSQARLVSIAPYYVVSRQEPHIVLHTEDRRTYLRANDFAFELGTYRSYVSIRLMLFQERKEIWFVIIKNFFSIICTAFTSNIVWSETEILLEN